jgi:peroxiredoxin
MAADVGMKAPEFTLPNQDREAVTLSATLAKGPVVLAFFPAAFSGVCQKELCAFRDGLLGGLANLPKAQVFGVSVDTFFALKAFATEQKLTFPLLSDFNKDTIRAYGVYNPDMVGLKGVAKRSVFVISADGVIRYKEVLEDARNEPDYQKLDAALAAV